MKQHQQMKRIGISIFHKSYEDKPAFYQLFRKTYMYLVLYYYPSINIGYTISVGM